jgi:hypothetical protein
MSRETAEEHSISQRQTISAVTTTSSGKRLKAPRDSYKVSKVTPGDLNSKRGKG